MQTKLREGNVFSHMCLSVCLFTKPGLSVSGRLAFNWNTFLFVSVSCLVETVEVYFFLVEKKNNDDIDKRIDMINE